MRILGLKVRKDNKKENLCRKHGLGRRLGEEERGPNILFQKTQSTRKFSPAISDAKANAGLLQRNLSFSQVTRKALRAGQPSHPRRINQRKSVNASESNHLEEHGRNPKLELFLPPDGS